MTDRLLGQIVLHRELYSADPGSISRMVVRSPPVTRNPDGEAKTERADGVGMSLSPWLLRYLGHPEGFGTAFPWRSALYALRGECRRLHRYHREPQWDGALCERAVRAVVIERLTIREAADDLGCVYLVPILREALAFIEADMDGRQRALALEQTDAYVHTAPAHVRLPGLHALECPTCRREAAMLARTQARTASASAAD